MNTRLGRLVGIATCFITAACGLAPTEVAVSPPSAPTEEVAAPTPTMAPTESACSLTKAETLLTTPGGTESIAIAEDGSIYTADFCSGEVFHIGADGSTSVIATLPYGLDNPECVDGGLGVAIAQDGTIRVVVWSPDVEHNGVWKVSSDGAVEFAFPMPPDSAPIPNDIALDAQGNLYVTESGAGAVWVAPPGNAAAPWLQTDLLAPPAGQDFGANGITRLGDVIYVTNLGAGTILQVPIEADGSAGEPMVFATGINSPDGIAFDQQGDLYVSSPFGDQLVRVTPDGEVAIVADLGPLGVGFPTDVAFVPGPNGSNVVYLANPNPDETTSVSRIGLCPAGGG